MKSKVVVMVATATVCLIYFSIKNVLVGEQKVYINEVRSTTASANRDGYFGSDYIEVYNATEKEVSLDGWYFSDDETELEKSRISSVVIPAKSYEVFYADGVGEGENCLNFRISSGGEKVFLSNAEGALIDSIYVPQLRYGEVYARRSDGEKDWAVMEETMLSANADAKIYSPKTLEKPVFSHESGFYDEEFVLKLSCNPGEVIYYTLDGSIPTKESEIYKNGIKIKNITEQPNTIQSIKNVVTDWKTYNPPDEIQDKAVIVRAIAVNDKNYSSEVATNTYFVDLDQYKEKNILSVVAEYKDLFGDEGIFVTGKEYDEKYLEGVDEEALPSPNFVQRGRPWEVVGNLQIFEGGKEICNQPSGIRIQGGSSREGKIKRMSFFSRNAYSGSEYFEGLLLDGRKIHSIATNGNIANSILQQLATDRSVATQGMKRTSIFLNGEFYCDYDLMEKYSKSYFTQKYGVSEENLLVIRDGEVSEGLEEHVLFYKWLLKQAETEDLSIAENYEEIKQLMDIQSYIDYLCTNIYLCNMDMSETKNYNLWRSIEDDGSEFGDMRFRWMLYDIGALGGQISKRYYKVESAAEVNSFTETGRYVKNSMNEHTIYKGLMANEEFRQQFVTSFLDMANVNFSPENVKKVFTEWDTAADAFGDFFEKRFDYIVPYMAEEFDLTGTLEEVTLKVNDTEGGIICLNTTKPDLSDGSWTGKYYTDYPVTITAVPKDGYEFAGWTGSVTAKSDTIEVEVAPGGFMLEAAFKKSEKFD